MTQSFVIRHGTGERVVTMVCCSCAGITLVVVGGPPAPAWVGDCRVLHCAVEDGTASDGKEDLWTLWEHAFNDPN